MHFCLHRGRGFVSGLIRWQTRSIYSHVSMLFGDGVVIEAREFVGVHSLPGLRPRDGEVIDIYRVVVTPEQERSMRAWAESQIGRPYDYLSILRFITREPVRRWQRNDWFCSEFAFYAAKLVGLRLLQNIEPWAVSPAQFALSPELHYERREAGKQIY